MQEEWDRQERSRQPLLKITTAKQLTEHTKPESGATEDNEQGKQNNKLPWSEEQSPRHLRSKTGYDGNLT